MQIDSGAGRVFFAGPFGVCAFILRRNRESNSSECKCPVDTCCHQFLNGWLLILIFSEKEKINANR